MSAGDFDVVSDLVVGRVHPLSYPVSDPAKPARYFPTVELQMWAIRRRSDGRYLPGVPVGSARGYSHLEPVSPDEASPPRMFRTERAARVALAMWLKGRYVRVSGPLGIAVSWDQDTDERFEWMPVEGRRTEDMEVVSVRLTIPK